MRIGALATATGTTAKTIRFYEQGGLIPDPPRTNPGYRDYPPDAPARLAFIRAAQSCGLILAVREHGREPCIHIAAVLRAHLTEIERRLAELNETRAVLRDLLAKGESTDPDTCIDGSCANQYPSTPASQRESEPRDRQ